MTILKEPLRGRIQKILDDQACVPWWDGEPCCSHEDHDGFMWPDGAVQCNGASDLLPLLRAALAASDV